MQEEERQPLGSSQLLWNWEKAQTYPETLQHSGLQPAYVSDLSRLFSLNLILEEKELSITRVQNKWNWHERLLCWQVGGRGVGTLQ